MLVSSLSSHQPTGEKVEIVGGSPAAHCAFQTSDSKTKSGDGRDSHGPAMRPNKDSPSAHCPLNKNICVRLSGEKKQSADGH